MSSVVNQINQTGQLFMDGTFRICPNGFEQVLSHCQYNRDVILFDRRRPKHFVETILIEDVTGKMSGNFLDGLVNSKHIPNDEVIKNFCSSWKPVFYCVNYLLEKEKLNFEDRKKKLSEGYFIQSSAASYVQFKFFFPSYNDCCRMTDIFNWLTSQAMEHIAPLNSRNKFFNRKLSILGNGIITTSLPKETSIRNRVLFNHDIHHLERKICEAFDGLIYSAYLTTRNRITIKIKQKYKYFPMFKVNMIIDHWSSVEQQVMKEKIIISKLQNAFYLPNMLWISDDDYYIYFAYPFATISTMNSFLKYLIRSSSKRKQKK
ncbi:hypothetical protein SNEBB_006696 [Seison nebaliae]|nr:hypothetical protein SNEBB_006696 [Seison nebaliae]